MRHTAGVELKLMASVLRSAVAATAVTDVVQLQITQQCSHPAPRGQGMCHPQQLYLCREKCLMLSLS